ncbi:MAG: hypothetical protein JWM27_1564 [Gemmatimonadetes bacterium]|nr:hypothetical protein [Gemmatimonadota bacterium]
MDPLALLRRACLFAGVLLTCVASAPAAAQARDPIQRKPAGADTSAADSARMRDSIASATKLDARIHASVDSAVASIRETPPYAFPKPWASSLLIAAVLGMLGGLVGDLLANHNALLWVKPDKERGLDLGSLSSLLIGAVAAVIVCILNRPNGSWPQLIGTALSAGVGGKAVLQAIAATGRMKDALKDTEVARAETLQVAGKAATAIELVGEQVKTLHTSLAHPMLADHAKGLFASDAKAFNQEVDAIVRQAVAVLPSRPALAGELNPSGEERGASGSTQ